MRTLALALILACLGLAPAQAQTVGPPAIVCNQSFQISQAATALAKIVTGGARTISVCGWAINSGSATSTAQLKYGSGTNCGTNTGTLTPAVSLAINGSYVDHIPFAFQSLPKTDDLCLVTTGTGPAQVTVYYGIN